MTTPSDIAKAQADNWASNDGVDPNVMIDLGYTPFESMPELFNRLNDQQIKVAPDVGRIIWCGCGKVIPCEHATGTRTIGY